MKNQRGRGEERLEGEWKAMGERVKGVEALLEKEKADHSEKQVSYTGNKLVYWSRKLGSQFFPSPAEDQ